MHKILVLWATPRSTSTAFEWMMRMRGDMTCFHEPFGEAWYQGEDARWPRIKADTPRTEGLTFDSVWQELKAAAAKSATFSKDFPHYIEHLWNDEFLDNFTPEQEEALRELIVEYKAKFPTIEKVTGHNSYATKACPCFHVESWL